MKILYSFILLFFINSCLGQVKLPTNDKGLVEFSKIITFDSTCSKDLIYNKFAINIAKIYNDSKSVIQLSDKEQGIIICKGVFEIGTFWGAVGYWNYTLTIEIKDSKARITISNLNAFNYPGNSWKLPTNAEELNNGEAPFLYASKWDRWRDNLIVNCNDLIASFSVINCSSKSEW